VTISAGASGTATANRLAQIRFGTATNAQIQSTSQVAAGERVSVTLPSGIDQYTFTVQRVTPGVATTVSLTVVDACGDWPTIVGGGPDAF
jgi:hypothetical protein